ncbi:acid protease [Mollisia scopiformis]|uniref:Acid protease n=1 Tax=Mollisia scopiformis TaxID=149040 RepID=A0A132B9F7_MOLSC|nr:acid protease [Mollisia scopiformis]KUJ09001.1 acid protease [Mollisia scopiformis]
MTILNLSLAALSLAAVSSAVVLPRNDTGSKGSLVQKRPVQGSGVLKVPVTKQTSTGITKRQDFDPLQNIYNGYLIGLEIGTPLQSLQVQIDTGSYELWVDPDCANGNDPTYCETFNVYYPGNSSTASDEGESFDLLYGTGEATGEYLIDDIVIGSGSIPQTQFGWATWSTFVNAGLMGIGLGYPWNLDYYGVIDQLYVYGVTASRAFSLDLASIDVADGSIIFGGIDTMKYIGSLYTAPMIDGPDSPDGSWRYWIYMSYVGVTLPNTTTSIPCTTSTYEQGMFPDSGATLSQFPPNLFNAVIGHFPSAVQQSDGSYTVDCALRNQAGTIDFGFGTKMIHVNFYDWLWAANGLCYFGAQPNPDTFSLGDSFIRSAYCESSLFREEQK